jgi:hypothetical protein
MNKKFDDLLYQSGLTAQGCWDQMDDYDRAAIEKFAELIVRECISRVEGCAVENPNDDEFVKGYNKGVSKVTSQVKAHFGVDE